MRPILFELFGVKFPAYGALLAIGSLIYFLWSYFEARRTGLDTNKILDVCFWMILGGIAGSRILHVLVQWDYFRNHTAEAFRLWNGGLVLYGGWIGVVLTAVATMAIFRLPLAKTSDVLASGFPLGVAIGRLGCLLNGCCYGRPCDMPWAMTYTHANSSAWLVKGIAVHPAPVYTIAMLLFIFAVLVILTRRKSFDGQVVWAWAMLYPIGRFIVELYRGDPRGQVMSPFLSKTFAFLIQNQTYSDTGHGGFFRLPVLSISQVIGLAMFVVGLAGYVITSRRAARRKGEYDDGGANNLQSSAGHGNNQ